MHGAAQCARVSVITTALHVARAGQERLELHREERGELSPGQRYGVADAATPAASPQSAARGPGFDPQRGHRRLERTALLNSSAALAKSSRAS